MRHRSHTRLPTHSHYRPIFKTLIFCRGTVSPVAGPLQLKCTNRLTGLTFWKEYFFVLTPGDTVMALGQSVDDD